MYLSIISVKPIKDYHLELEFENNEKRIFDFNSYLDIGLFSELRNESLFKTVHVSFDTIGWNNGADFDPEILYEKSVPITGKFTA